MKLVDKQSKEINCPAQRLYDFLCDFHHFEKLLPEQVTNWETDGTTCSFKIPNLGVIVIRMETDDANQRIKYISTSGPAPFEILFESEAQTPESSQLTLSAFVDAPSFMLMMIGKPIKNFVGMVLEKIKEVAETGFLA